MTRKAWMRSLLYVLGLVFLLDLSEAAAGTKRYVGRTVPADQRVSIDQVDHAIWDALLKQYVDAQGRVDYRSWKESQAALDQYLGILSRADLRVRADRRSQLAFWINAYNAVTVKGILQEYPTSSIRNHTARLYGYNIWHDLLLIVGGSQISLNDIEHEVLRKSGEPRIHFAIVCASHSCPPLRREAYTREKLEEQLNTNAAEFFANPENFRYESGTFHMSSVIKWFDEDFGDDQAARLRYLASFLPDGVSRRAAASGTGRISYLSYDWSLNDQ